MLDFLIKKKLIAQQDLVRRTSAVFSKIQLGPYQDPSVPNVFLSWTYRYEILQMQNQKKWWSKYLELC